MPDEGKAGRGAEPPVNPNDVAAASPRASRPATSSSGPSKALSAARAQPLKVEQKRITTDSLKEGAADTALNVLSILREVWEDFRNSDRYFKYKAGIIAAWLVLSLTGVVVACPSGEGGRNDIGAHLVLAGDTERPIYMIRNQSQELWTNVLVTVNKRYRASAAQIAPDRELTLTAKQLVGNDGAPAPETLRVQELEVATSQGKAVLMHRGKPSQ